MFTIGIVGAGRLSRVHLRHLSRIPDTSFVYFDQESQYAEALATEYPGKVVKSFAEMLTQVDAVDIITPNGIHAEYAVASINASKHTFIEKPLDVSCEAAKPVLEAANNNNVTVQVGHVLRYFAMYSKAHNMIKSGAVGVPAAIRMTRGGGMPGGESGWFADHNLSGGIFVDLAIHDLDWLLWSVGPVKEVYAKSVEQRLALVLTMDWQPSRLRMVALLMLNRLGWIHKRAVPHSKFVDLMGFSITIPATQQLFAQAINWNKITFSKTIRFSCNSMILSIAQGKEFPRNLVFKKLTMPSNWQKLVGLVPQLARRSFCNHATPYQPNKLIVDSL